MMASSKEAVGDCSAQESSGDSLCSEDEVLLPTVNERLGGKIDRYNLGKQGWYNYGFSCT